MTKSPKVPGVPDTPFRVRLGDRLGFVKVATEMLKRPGAWADYHGIPLGAGGADQLKLLKRLEDYHPGFQVNGNTLAELQSPPT